MRRNLFAIKRNTHARSNIKTTKGNKMTPPATAIRNEAVKQLIKKHRAEFDRIYVKEAKKAGTIYKYSTERIRVTDKQIKALIKNKKVSVR